MTSATEPGIEGDRVHTSVGQGGAQAINLKGFGLFPSRETSTKSVSSLQTQMIRGVCVLLLCAQGYTTLGKYIDYYLFITHEDR